MPNQTITDLRATISWVTSYLETVCEFDRVSSCHIEVRPDELTLWVTLYDEFNEKLSHSQRRWSGLQSCNFSSNEHITRWLHSFPLREHRELEALCTLTGACLEMELRSASAREFAERLHKDRERYAGLLTAPTLSETLDDEIPF